MQKTLINLARVETNFRKTIMPQTLSPPICEDARTQTNFSPIPGKNTDADSVA